MALVLYGHVWSAACHVTLSPRKSILITHWISQVVRRASLNTGEEESKKFFSPNKNWTLFLDLPACIMVIILTQQSTILYIFLLTLQGLLYFRTPYGWKRYVEERIAKGYVQRNFWPFQNCHEFCGYSGLLILVLYTTIRSWTFVDITLEPIQKVTSSLSAIWNKYSCNPFSGLKQYIAR